MAIASAQEVRASLATMMAVSEFFGQAGGRSTAYLLTESIRQNSRYQYDFHVFSFLWML